MWNALKIVGIPACIFLVPLLLEALYVGVIRGESVSSSFLHWTYEVLIVTGAIPFIAMLRISVGFRIVIAVLLLPVVFGLTIIDGLFVACAIFHSCP